MTTVPPIGTIIARKGTLVPDWPLFALDWRGQPIPYTTGTFTVTIRQAGEDTVTTDITIVTQTPSGDGSNPAVDIPSMYAHRTTSAALDQFAVGKAELIVEHSTERVHAYDLKILR